MDHQQKQSYTFEQFARDVIIIAAIVRKMEEKRGRKFQKIYAPLRGGAILAVCLSHQLSDEKAGHRIIVVAGLPTAYEEDALVVDDIADTGKTLHQLFTMGFPVITLFKQIDCSFTPEISLHVKRLDWVEFWWEADDLFAELSAK